MNKYVVKRTLTADQLHEKDSNFFDFLLHNMINTIEYKIQKFGVDKHFEIGLEVFEALISSQFCMECTSINNSPNIEGTILGIPFEVESLSCMNPLEIVLYADVPKKYYGFEYKYCVIDEFLTDNLFEKYFGDVKRKGDNMPEIKKVIFNGPATIVFWKDNTKTIVKCMPGETFDPEKGILVALYKKMSKDKQNYFKDIKKWANSYKE